MSDFNTKAGQVAARELLLLFLNTGSSEAPVWSVLGKRVEDSSEELDWGAESKTDILGKTYTTFKKPTITQTFDPCELDAADVAQQKIWGMAIKDQDTAALAAQDMLVVHCYAGTADTDMFAERYDSCAIEVTGLGGSTTITMPINVTFGGTRTTGTASMAKGIPTFKANTAE